MGNFEPYFDYNIKNEELYRWMKNVKRQSVDLAKKTIEDFKGIVKAGTKATVKEAVNMFTIQFIFRSYYFSIYLAFKNMLIVNHIIYVIYM